MSTVLVKRYPSGEYFNEPSDIHDSKTLKTYKGVNFAFSLSDFICSLYSLNKVLI